MKFHFTSFLSIFLITYTFVHADGAMIGELEISGIPPGNTVILTAEGTAWNGINEGWTICTDNNLLNITLTGESLYYLDFITDDQANQGPHGTICHGKYKMQMGSNIVFIDWRDCDYNDLNSQGTNYITADIYIRWNPGMMRFEHKDKVLPTWHGISPNSTVGIWDGNRKTNNIPAFDHFQPTNPTNLTKLSDYNNHPRFIFDESIAPTDPNNLSSITYNIFRRTGFGPFLQISTNLNVNTYIDYEVYNNISGIRHEYKINANSGDSYIQSPSFSNRLFYRGWLGRQSQASSTHILDGFDSKTISTNTMSINLTNVNALNWFIEGSYIGVEWLSGANDLVFTHGLWLTGMADGSLMGTTSSWGFDYSPGPIIDNQAAMIAQPNDSTTYRIYHIDQNSGPGDSDYDEWPVHWGAPKNPDGSPKIYGDQTAFMIYNDAHPSVELRGLPESDATPIEIHETVWSHSEADASVNVFEIQNIIFYRYQLFNRGSTDIIEASLALWTDLDIYDASANWGGYNDNGNYAYNYLYQNGYEGYIPRAIAYVLLQGPLTEQNGGTGIAFGQEFSDKTNLGTTASWFIEDDSLPVGDGDNFGVFPDELEQLRNITLGLMPNGDPIVHPITGEITSYTHDGNPATGEGWLHDVSSGGGAGFVSSSSNFDISSGDSTEAIFAMVVALGDSFSDALVNLENQVMDLRDWWEENQLDIYDENYEQIPDSFELLNAYPNPFNPTTNIQFNVRSESDISLQILDISGRAVETLLNGIVPMGRQDIQWNPQNHASGIYFIHLSSQFNSQSKKIVYLK